eukprot:663856-Prorocentrum_minimum.AAC.1
MYSTRGIENASASAPDNDDGEKKSRVPRMLWGCTPAARGVEGVAPHDIRSAGRGPIVMLSGRTPAARGGARGGAHRTMSGWPTRTATCSAVWPLGATWFTWAFLPPASSSARTMLTCTDASSVVFGPSSLRPSSSLNASEHAARKHGQSGGWFTRFTS